MNMISTILSKIRHPLVANSFYLYVAHFADYLLALIILPFIARVLGPEELGYVGLAQTFGIFILLIMEFGFPLTATRKVAREKNNPKNIKVLINGESLYWINFLNLFGTLLKRLQIKYLK